MSRNPDNPQGDPDAPDGISTEGKTVPPYEGRQKSADVDGKEDSTKDGAKTAGATGLVEDDDMKAPEPSATDRGATATPSDEQPASQMPETDLDDDAVGPAHVEGSRRAEEQP